jgi:hypothetical protein
MLLLKKNKEIKKLEAKKNIYLELLNKAEGIKFCLNIFFFIFYYYFDCMMLVAVVVVGLCFYTMQFLYINV